MQYLTLCFMLTCGFGFKMAIGQFPGIEKSDALTIARCRSRCISKFKPNNSSSDACQDNRNCAKCWKTCDLMFTSYRAWSQICTRSKRLCNSGCQTACRFRENTPKVNPSETSCEFTDNPQILDTDTVAVPEKVAMIWTLRCAGSSTLPQGLVYTLYVRDQVHPSEDWQSVLQTSSMVAVLDVNELPTMPEFLLLAVTSNGIVAHRQFISETFDESPIAGEVFITSDRLPLVYSPNARIKYFEDSSLNISLDMTVIEGRIHVQLHWDHPDLDSNSTPRGATSKYEYEVNYFLSNCDCGLPGEHYSKFELYNNRSKQAVVRIPDVVFSGEYMVDVVNSWFPKWKGRVEFFTPDCPGQIDYKFTRCKSQINPLQRLTTKTKGMKSVSPSSGLETTTKLPVDRGPHHVTQTDEVTDPYPGMAVFGEPEEVNMVPQMHLLGKQYDADHGVVVVKINWTSPFNTSAFNISLTFWNWDHENGVDVGETFALNSTSAVFQGRLRPNERYSLRLDGYYLKDDGSTGKFESPILDVNTHDTEKMEKYLAHVPIAAAKEINILNGIILGVTVLASIIFFGIVVVFIYKKRKSFRDIIILKSAVAKSNSYKSNVGCKADYSNQMLMVSDDWEIDRHLLKFSTPIGQGAFGKVVTGTYKDRKVAIKLVRDSAPISYKEDLLAEIHLMKRIGSHPNIVSMIGAVTLAEPIALIMEYIPKGNLQNFLKKCRLEGETKQNGRRGTELVYSIMDESGGMDEGVITPADMLSFARQVAMAMDASLSVLNEKDADLKVPGEFAVNSDVEMRWRTPGKPKEAWEVFSGVIIKVGENEQALSQFATQAHNTVIKGKVQPGTPVPKELFSLKSSDKSDGKRERVPTKRLEESMEQAEERSPKKKRKSEHGKGKGKESKEQAKEYSPKKKKPSEKGKGKNKQNLSSSNMTNSTETTSSLQTKQSRCQTGSSLETAREVIDLIKQFSQGDQQDEEKVPGAETQNLTKELRVCESGSSTKLSETWNKCKSAMDTLTGIDVASAPKVPANQNNGPAPVNAEIIQVTLRGLCSQPFVDFIKNLANHLENSTCDHTCFQDGSCKTIGQTYTSTVSTASGSSLPGPTPRNPPSVQSDCSQAGPSIETPYSVPTGNQGQSSKSSFPQLNFQPEQDASCSAIGHQTYTKIPSTVGTSSPQVSSLAGQSASNLYSVPRLVESSTLSSPQGLDYQYDQDGSCTTIGQTYTSTIRPASSSSLPGPTPRNPSSVQSDSCQAGPSNETSSSVPNQGQSSTSSSRQLFQPEQEARRTSPRKRLQSSNTNAERVSLIPTSNITVSKTGLRKACNTAKSKKDTKPAYFLMYNLLDEVYTIDVLAKSRGTGIGTPRAGQEDKPILDEGIMKVLKDVPTCTFGYWFKGMGSEDYYQVEYLADKKYVHRDLAARNVLLGYDKVIKVCDFGLSRDIYNDNMYKKMTNGKLPLKWMAIESLRDRIFTTQSDVWSFGVLLWEIVTMGASPYPSIALADLYYVLANNYRMEKPSNCSDELYVIMRQCWLEEPDDRPTFTELRVQLELLLSRDRNYLELDNINVPLSTPETSSSTPVSDDTKSLLAAQALQNPGRSSKDDVTVKVCVHDKNIKEVHRKKGEFEQRNNITFL